MSKTTLNNGKAVTYTYDNLGRLTNKSLNTSTAISSAYTYEVSDRGTVDGKTYTTTKIETETIGGTKYRYVYDANGNITRIYSVLSEDSEITLHKYTYDNYGQLSNYWLDGTNGNEMEYGVTSSNGVELGINAGFVSASGQLGISIDDSGNVALQVTGSLKLSFFTGIDGLGVSGGSYSMITNAPSVYYLEGEGYQIGGDFSCPIPETPISVYSSSDINMIPYQNTCYFGYSRSRGVSYPSSPVSVGPHVAMGQTFTICDFNIFDMFGG